MKGAGSDGSMITNDDAHDDKLFDGPGPFVDSVEVDANGAD